jgi:hypothetical protein
VFSLLTPSLPLVPAFSIGEEFFLDFVEEKRQKIK